MINLRMDADDVLEMLDNAQDLDFHDPIEAGLAIFHDEIVPYPSPPAGSTYRRKGALGRSWTTKLAANGKSGELGNAVRGPRGQQYGPYVQDARRQARVHRGRWQTDEQVVERNERRIRGIFENHIQRQLGQ